MNSNKGSDISNMIGSSDRGDTWAEWSRHVLIELDRLNKCYRVLRWLRSGPPVPSVGFARGSARPKRTSHIASECRG